MWGISVLQSNVVSDAPVDGGEVRFDACKPRISPIPSSDGQHDDTIPQRPTEAHDLPVEGVEDHTCALSTAENSKNDSKGTEQALRPGTEIRRTEG